jgi:hypothetical protein
MRVVAEPERRPRMTVLGDVRVELLSGGCEAFVIGLGAEDDGPLRDEQWARLQEVAIGTLGRALARDDPNAIDVAHHAGTARGVGLGQRFVTDSATGGPDLAERAIRVTHERTRRPPPPRPLSTGTRRRGAAAEQRTRPGRARGGSHSARRRPSSSPHRAETDARAGSRSKAATVRWPITRGRRAGGRRSRPPVRRCPAGRSSAPTAHAGP